jgi:hypothetical protein
MDIQYTVDHETQHTEHHERTPHQILAQASIDPETFYLVETHPQEVSFEGKGDEKIQMQQHMKFKSVKRAIDYKVNDEPQHTDRHKLTASQILTHAGIDPATNYLVEIHPHRISFEGKPNEEIHLQQHMKFISVSLTPTPVSEK